MMLKDKNSLKNIDKLVKDSFLMKLNIIGIVNIIIPVGFTRNSKPKVIPEIKA
jgi:hypothetical protein